MPRRKEAENPVSHKINPNVMGLSAEIIEQPIVDTLETNYMPYAMSVIVSRAIPEIDGFKPSHRKLLYTMYKMGLLSGGRTKSANIVGQTMRLNPHGDAAIYDTMVRLSKGYGALLHPFVDSKGNFGKVYSRDMAWAASRYTEAKLSDICSEVFKDIDCDTVDFVDNYDNTMKEPALLPTTFPNVLVSANQGIAVGMASQLCGFNLNEVCDTTIAYLRNPNCKISDTLLAPDLPTGGEVVFDANAIEEIYRTGRGGVKVRAKWKYEKKDNLIEIYEIPYSTTSEAIMDKVAELVKAGKIKEIADMRDETDLSGLKLTIDLKRGVDPEQFMRRMFKLTPLMDTVSCNFNILIHGTPRVMGVAELLGEWCNWRINSVSRRTTFVLRKKEDKLHLLKGLESILVDIDKAVKIIRKTEKEDDVVPNLMAGFGIDRIQAEYVAEIKLRNINKEYIAKRVSEISALEKEIAELKDILEHPEKIKKIIIRELEDVKKKYGAERKTTISYENGEDGGEEEDELPADYPVNVFLSEQGYFKKITPLSLRMSGEHKYKEGDSFKFTAETTNNSEVMFFTNCGQVYKAHMYDFDDTKASALGEYIPSKLNMDEGESVIYMVLPNKYEGFMLFFFENGKVAKIDINAYKTVQNRKKLKNAYCVKSPLKAVMHLTTDTDVAVFSSDARAIAFNTSRLMTKASSVSQGVAVLSTKKNRMLADADILNESGIVNTERYIVKTLPSSGVSIKGEDMIKSPESQSFN